MHKFSFNSSPAWTFAHRYGAKENVREPHGPGPGSYNLSKANGKAHGCKIGSSKRDSNYPAQSVPGPGAYQLPRGTSAPKVSFGSKGKVYNTELYPGPGSYNAYSTAVFKSVPGGTLGSKYSSSELNAKNQTPGPGQYDLNAASMKQPAVRIGTAKRSSVAPDSNPGPGTYGSSGRPFSAGPRYGFGKAGKGGNNDEATPGPGQYQSRHFLDDRSNMKGVTLSSRHEVHGVKSFDTPGPGQYNLNSTMNRPSSGVKIGTSNRYNKTETFTPGPGQYYGDYHQKGSLAAKIGTSTRGGLNNQVTPGPGSYEINGVGTQGAGGITISGHKYRKNGDDVPGPGTYEPHMAAIKQRPATAKIGSGKRSTNLHSDTPGPGYYSYADHNQGPKFAFNRQLRSKDAKGSIPGPADYDIPSSIPNVPGYIMSSVMSSKERHYA